MNKRATLIIIGSMIIGSLQFCSESTPGNSWQINLWNLHIHNNQGKDCVKNCKKHRNNSNLKGD